MRCPRDADSLWGMNTAGVHLGSLESILGFFPRMGQNGTVLTISFISRDTANLYYNVLKRKSNI